MDLPNQTLGIFSRLEKGELSLWEEAYSAVESYLLALRLKNKLLVAELVRRVLLRAYDRYDNESGETPRLLAMDEVLNEVADWTCGVLGEPLANRRLAARGRTALLLVGMSDQWQSVFLTPAPWPESFVLAMKRAYLESGPHFAELAMYPKSLELNSFGSGAAQWGNAMNRLPYIRYTFYCCLVLSGILTTWFIFLS
ncbi:MAG: hypothetical protein ACSHX0_03780 [Akkermansiaceae bacterium]